MGGNRRRVGAEKPRETQRVKWSAGYWSPCRRYFDTWSYTPDNVEWHCRRVMVQRNGIRIQRKNKIANEVQELMDEINEGADLDNCPGCFAEMLRNLPRDRPPFNRRPIAKQDPSRKRSRSIQLRNSPRMHRLPRWVKYPYPLRRASWSTSEESSSD